MPLQELWDLFDVRTQQQGSGWTKVDTRNAIIQKLKEKLEAAGLDSSTVKPPCNETILSYDAALMSMPDFLIRACQPKNALRKASDTSIHSMLTFVCAILVSCAYVSPSTESIPPEYHFDESKATEGCKLARRLVAKSLGVPEHTVHFIPRELVLNQDDMAQGRFSL